jgi:hypothetical protein
MVLQDHLRLYKWIAYRDQQRVLKVLFGPGHEHKSHLIPLTICHAENGVVLSFIAKYSGDADACQESWVEKELASVSAMKQWSTETILAQVEELELEWLQRLLEFQSEESTD